MEKLLNIGPVLEGLLRSVGYTSHKDLQKDGTEKVFSNILKADNSACIHKLYAIHGAINNIKKKDISEEDKKILKEFFRKIKK